MKAPARVAGVFFFACAMDPSGLKDVEPSPLLSRCFGRHANDYGRLSSTPEGFKEFTDAVDVMMRTQPNYAPHELAAVGVPVAIVQSERDEFITHEHGAYLARTIPNAELVVLPGVSHFAPLQRPAQFNAALLAFAERVSPAARA